MTLVVLVSAGIAWAQVDHGFSVRPVVQHFPQGSFNCQVNEDGTRVTLCWTHGNSEDEYVYRTRYIEYDVAGDQFLQPDWQHGAALPANHRSRYPRMVVNEAGLPVTVWSREYTNVLNTEVATARDPNGALTFTGPHMVSNVTRGFPTFDIARRPMGDPVNPDPLYVGYSPLVTAQGVWSLSIARSDDGGATWADEEVDLHRMAMGVRFADDASSLLVKGAMFDPWFAWPGNYPNGYRLSSKLLYLAPDPNGSYTGAEPVELVSNENDYTVWDPQWSYEDNPAENHPQEFAQLSEQIIDHDIGGVDITRSMDKTVFAYQIRRGPRLLDEYMSTGVVDLHEPVNWQELRLGYFDTAVGPDDRDFDDPNNYVLLAIDNTQRSETGYFPVDGVNLVSDDGGNLYCVYAREWVGGQYMARSTEIVFGTKRAGLSMDDPNAWKWETIATMPDVEHVTGATLFDLSVHDVYADGSEVDVYLGYHAATLGAWENKQIYLASCDYDALPGDANLDDVVDVGDLGILAGHWGQSGAIDWGDADFNHDGVVDVGDLGILAGNWGTSQTSVPEPTGIMVLVGLAILRRRRR
jgi:hypothetical protein